MFGAARPRELNRDTSDYSIIVFQRIYPLNRPVLGFFRIYLYTGELLCENLQAGDDDVEHGGEGLSTIGDALVDDDGGEPHEQRPRQEENAVQRSEPKALGQPSLFPILVRLQECGSVGAHRLLFSHKCLDSPNIAESLNRQASDQSEEQVHQRRPEHRCMRESAN